MCQESKSLMFEENGNSTSTSNSQPTQEMVFPRLVTPPGTNQIITAEGLLVSRILRPVPSVTLLRSGIQTENVGRKVSGTTLTSDVDRKMLRRMITLTLDQLQQSLKLCRMLASMTSPKLKPTNVMRTDSLMQLQSEIQALKIGRKQKVSRTINVDGMMVRRMVTTRTTNVKKNELRRRLTPSKIHPVSGTASSMELKPKFKSTRYQKVSIHYSQIIGTDRFVFQL